MRGSWRAVAMWTPAEQMPPRRVRRVRIRATGRCGTVDLIIGRRGGWRQADHVAVEQERAGAVVQRDGQIADGGATIVEDNQRFVAARLRGDARLIGWDGEALRCQPAQTYLASPDAHAMASATPFPAHRLASTVCEADFPPKRL